MDSVPERPEDEAIPDTANQAYERERRIALRRVYELIETWEPPRRQDEREADVGAADVRGAAPS